MVGILVLILVIDRSKKTHNRRNKKKKKLTFLNTNDQMEIYFRVKVPIDN